MKKYFIFLIFLLLFFLLITVSCGSEDIAPAPGPAMGMIPDKPLIGIPSYKIGS